MSDPLAAEVVLSVRALRKSYGDLVAVDGIGFEARRGEIVGLLGPNGAGKTSTLECIEGIRRRNGGEIEVMGVDPGRQPRRLNRLIGVQLQTSGLPEDMRVDEAMRFFGAYHRVEPREDLIERVGLAEHRRQRYGQLSTGLKRRLALAVAVIHDPPILILDEPTAGLDVASRAELHTMLRQFRAEGTTVLLATHDMAEAEKLADRVEILLRGKIVASGSPQQLTATGAGYTRISVNSERGVLAEMLPSLPGVVRSATEDGYAICFSNDPGKTVSAALAYLEEAGDELIDLRVERPSLEERFLELTGNDR